MCCVHCAAVVLGPMPGSNRVLPLGKNDAEPTVPIELSSNELWPSLVWGTIMCIMNHHNSCTAALSDRNPMVPSELLCHYHRATLSFSLALSIMFHLPRDSILSDLSDSLPVSRVETKPEKLHSVFTLLLN